MDVIVVCVGAAVSLASWVAIYLKLAALPRTVWHIVRQERTAEAEKAQFALQEAVALKVGAIVRSLREHQEQSAAGYLAQVADAENRARVGERRAAEAGVALSAVSELVRDSRALRDDLRGLVATAAAPAAPVADPDQRETKERERPSPRQAAPGLDPPGSAVPLSSEPAMKAAGLGPRPTSRPAPKEEPPRRPTLLGMRPPLRPPPLRAPDADDEDRPSDDEVTRVGALPPASALATTLLSMPAVAQPNGGKRGGS